MKTPFLLHETLMLTAERSPDKTALVCGDERWSYAQLDELSTRLACALHSLGVRCGDRILIFLDNCSEGVLSIYGASKAGSIFVPVNGSIKGPKLAYIARDSGARLLVAHTGKARVVREAMDLCSEFPHVLWVGDPSALPPALAGKASTWDEVFAPTGAAPVDQGQRLPADESPCIDQDLAALIYTSGSTGEPKGVMCPHCSMLAVARSTIQYLENTPEDIILNVLPLSFGYGLYQVIMAFMFGGTVVLERSFSFPVKILQRMEKERATGFPLVPTIAAMMLRLQNLGNFDLSSLRYMTNAAAALPVEHILKLRHVFPHVRFFSMYGQTECKRTSYLPPEELDRRPTSVGKGIPNCRVSVLDDRGCEVGPGQVGELVVRGANVMRGYWNAPELTARVFRQGLQPGETLLYSGDRFRRDEEGFLYFVGRKDDLIKTGGERVSPREIEAVLCGMDGVSEAAVVGVPDEVLGKAVKAFIVSGPNCSLTERQVMKYAADHLENFMVPKSVHFVNDLPRTPNGKIDKKALELM